MKKGFGLDFVLYIVFLQEGAPSTWAWALPRPDSPIPRHKPRGLSQPPDRDPESGSQVSLHLPLHSGLPLNLPPSPFLGWEGGHLISDWPPVSAWTWSWSSQHQLIFLCLSILENTKSSPTLSNAFFFACCATSQVKPHRQVYSSLIKSHHSHHHHLEMLGSPPWRPFNGQIPRRNNLWEPSSMASSEVITAFWDAPWNGGQGPSRRSQAM